MNERIKSLMDQVVNFHWDYDALAYEAQVHPEDLEMFAELIIRECVNIARNTNLEDVEGGDSAVLQAVATQIKGRFGLE